MTIHPTTTPLPACTAEVDPGQPPPALGCRDLTVAYGGRTAVDALGFTIRSGEAYGLLGPNGAGKTSTIRAICGLTAPAHGSITVHGRPMALGRKGREARSLVGYVPQDLALLPSLSVRENLGYWAAMLGVPRRDRARRIDRGLETAGLTDRATSRVETTSGGMQRRLNLAVALLHRPAVLVLDEPTVGVDAQSRADLLDTLSELRGSGVSILYTSHYMEEVARLCDRVGIVDHGRLLVEGCVDELVGSHHRARDLEELFLDLTGRALRP